MKIISHRVNSVKQLKQISNGFGIEIDVRSWNNDLILQHEPFEKGELFSEWLQNYEHEILIVNIKCEGLESRILEYIKKIKPEIKYFFLDQSFPYLVKTLFGENLNTALRVSEFENSDSATNLAAKWVWIDSHTGNWDHLIPELHKAKKYGRSTCLASPELHGRLNSNERALIKRLLIESHLQLDAICTKNPDSWEDMSGI